MHHLPVAHEKRDLQQLDTEAYFSPVYEEGKVGALLSALMGERAKRVSQGARELRSE
jgi:hypothetical protein